MKRLFRRRKVTKTSGTAAAVVPTTATGKNEEDVRLEGEGIVEEAAPATTNNNPVQRDESRQEDDEQMMGAESAIEKQPPPDNSFQSMEPVVDNEEFRVLKEVDSADVPEPHKSFLQELLFRMSPSQCMPGNFPEAIDSCGVIAYKSCVAGGTEEFEWLLPGMLNDIGKGSTKTRSAALLKLYRLLDRDHKENRTSAVCSTKFGTIPILSASLSLDVPDADRRQALLILNNLCIPNENKAVILFGDSSTTLLTALLQLIRSRTAECYLALVTLVNLSFLVDEQAKAMLLNFVPEVSTEEAPTTYRFHLPANNPLSLLRTLENVLRDYVPYLETHHSVNSVEQQCCRWAMNALRNLATVQDNAVVMATKTRVPEHAVDCLRCANKSNLKEWTRDSLEDAALMLLVHLGKDDDCLVAMRENSKLRDDIHAICDALAEDGKGIHCTRAIALKERFDEALAEKSEMGYSV